MKSILFSILLLCIPKLSISQVSANDKMILLDSTFNETNYQNHTYYRIIRDYTLHKESYVINDYYKSGVLLSKGMSSSRDYILKEGMFTYYYENKNKKTMRNFKKDYPIGKKAEWYENGNKKEEGEYTENTNKDPKFTYRVAQFWDSNGVQKVIDGNGDYEDGNNNLFNSGKIKNGVKDGIWQGWIDNPNNKYNEQYKNGEFISGTITNKNNIKRTYTILEKKPEPKYGMDDFYKYIARNYRIPKNLPKGTSGKIFIIFVVDKEGKIVEPKILKDIGYGTGTEAIRILSDYDDFIPGEQRGRKVRCTYSLPISIQSPL